VPQRGCVNSAGPSLSLTDVGQAAVSSGMVLGPCNNETPFLQGSRVRSRLRLGLRPRSQPSGGLVPSDVHDPVLDSRREP
jgi:hypothetical protein